MLRYPPCMNIANPTSTDPTPSHQIPTLRHVDDQLWSQLAPILGSEEPRKKRGRPRCSDRQIVNGLLWLAYTRAAWSELPAEFGSKSTCHKRFQEWIAQGVFGQAWALLLVAYADLAELNWSWQAAGEDTSAATSKRKGLWAPRKLSDALSSAEQTAVNHLLHDARFRQMPAAA